MVKFNEKFKERLNEAMAMRVLVKDKNGEITAIPLWLYNLYCMTKESVEALAENERIAKEIEKRS